MTPDYSLSVSWWIGVAIRVLVMVALAVVLIRTWQDIHRTWRDADDLTNAYLKSKREDDT